MKFSIRAITMMSVLSLSLPLSPAALAGSDDVVVENPWSRASIGTTRPGVAYTVIRNNGATPVTLTGLRTEAAMMAQVHRTSTDAQGVSSMTPAGDIVIAPGASVALEPGGLHAMLMKLQRPLTEGDSFPLVLVFEDGEVSIDVPVLGISARGPKE